MFNFSSPHWSCCRYQTATWKTSVQISRAHLAHNDEGANAIKISKYVPIAAETGSKSSTILSLFYLRICITCSLDHQSWFSIAVVILGILRLISYSSSHIP